jgi:type IV fimbrial biogenesis protein FimT
MLNKLRGVSLIELMVAIVIISVLTMMAVPSYSGWIQNQQIRTAAESILNGLQVARSEAVKNNAQARFVLCGLPLASWEVLAASATVAVAPTASLACGGGSNAAAGEIRVQERSSQEGSKLAQVSSANGANTVTFNSLGRVVSPNPVDGSVPLAQVDVTTQTGTRPLKITIGSGGNIRMCDPSSSLSANDPRHCP